MPPCARAITPLGDGGVELTAADAHGRPVLAVRALSTRPVDAALLAKAGGQAAHPLYEVVWNEIEGPASERRVAQPEVVEVDAHRAGTVFVAAPIEPGDDPAAAAHASVHAALELLRERVAEDDETPIVFVTRGAVAVTEDEPPDLPGATFWGLMRSAQSEYPGRFVLLDAEPGAELPAGVPPDEPQLALRDGRLHVPRLQRVGEGEADVSFGDGTVLVTGGTGGLGALVARHLVERHGVRSLLLVSRRGASADGAAELQALDAEVEIAACDVTDRDALAALLDGRSLTGVVHCAGIAEDGTIATLQPDQVDRVLAAKVDAAQNLDDLTRTMPLEQFVLFSSAGPLLGGAGQGNYAAANAYLDALAERRRRDGLPATSMAWGLWAQESGMAAGLDDAGARQIRARLGLVAMAPEAGLELFDDALRADRPWLLTAHIDLTAHQALARVGRLPGLLRGLVKVPARRQSAGGSSLAKRLAALPESAWDEAVLTEVRTHVAAVLGHDTPDAIEPELPFSDLGFDSLVAIELRNRLIEVTGVQLPSTVAFDHPSPAAVARYLREQVSGVEVAAVASARKAADEPIAIVGIGCRYPGEVRSPEELWQLVSGRVDTVTDFPADRGWDVERLYDPDPDHSGTTYARGGAFLEDAGEFDPAFFGISRARGAGHGPAAAAVPRALVGGARARRDRPGLDARLGHRRVRGRDVPGLRLRRALDLPQRRDRGLRDDRLRGQRRLGPRRLQPRARRARRSRSTPPARPRWSPCTSRASRCARASARWRSPAARP